MLCVLVLLYMHLEWGFFTSLLVAGIVYGVISVFSACLEGIDWDDVVQQLEEEEKLKKEEEVANEQRDQEGDFEDVSKALSVQGWKEVPNLDKVTQKVEKLEREVKDLKLD